jgi:putative nucleotidyltransferase with HDIG domain
MNYTIPQEIISIIVALKKAGFDGYIVGGSVRDMLLGKRPKDWDIATNALPEDIQRIFPDSVYENTFGTVGVKTRSNDRSLAVVEVTTFRTEAGYADHRHPGEVSFAKTIEEDLRRRDFTINAMALGPDNSLIDPFEGKDDLERKQVRAVGDPTERFQEDALRLMRAVRFASELMFSLEKETAVSIKKNADLLEEIAKERIRDEFVKMIMSDGEGAMLGVIRLEQYGLLRHIMPELRKGIGVAQNKHHTFTVWEHNLKALDYAAQKGYSLEVRLGALLHDVGKPHTKRGEGENATFYAHEIVGARITKKILERLHFSKKMITDVVHLVRHHLFYYNVGEVTEAGVRRFIARVGEQYIDDLFKIREADRIGSGVPKAVPYKTRHLRFMIDKVRRDPISPRMLKVDGSDLMSELSIEPGPRLGKILAVLLEDVLDDPKRNDRAVLLDRAKALLDKTDAELDELSSKAKKTTAEYESGIEENIKNKYHV